MIPPKWNWRDKKAKKDVDKERKRECEINGGIEEKKKLFFKPIF